MRWTMKRVLIKLSGEALSHGTGEIYDNAFVDAVASEISSLSRSGYEIALVLGAGNIFRGRQGAEMDRTEADRMGMLATVINAICIKDAIKRAGTDARVMSTVSMYPMAENYSSDLAKEYLKEGKVVILGCGLGIPYLSTDTTAAVRSAELSCDAMFMAKNVDYIYTADPRIDKNAKKLEHVRASEVLSMNLKALDATATAFCLSTGMPIYVFGLEDAKDISLAIKGEKPGTVVLPE